MISSPQLLVKQSKKEYYEITKAKWEMVSSHTCRRTFCTLKFLKGMPAMAIMKFSGHKSERSFMKYLKLEAEVTAKKYREYFWLQDIVNLTIIFNEHFFKIFFFRSYIMFIIDQHVSAYIFVSKMGKSYTSN